MKRELTKREMVLLLVLLVLAISLGYFKLILEPIQTQVASCQDRAAQEQLELDQALVQVEQMQQMQKRVDEIRATGEERTIPQYDNSGKLMRELYQILENSMEYSLDFSEGTTQNGYIVMRPVRLMFQTGTYAQARAIVDALSESENLNQISDVTIQTQQGQQHDRVQTDLVITYFEVAP